MEKGRKRALRPFYEGLIDIYRTIFTPSTLSHGLNLNTRLPFVFVNIAISGLS